MEEKNRYKIQMNRGGSNPQTDDTGTIRDARSRVGVISEKEGRNQRGPGERDGDTGVRYQGNQGSREVKDTQGRQH